MAGMSMTSHNSIITHQTLPPIPPPNSTAETTTMTAAIIDHETPSSIPHPPRSHHQLNPSPSSSGGGERAAHPQWAHHETLELITVRGELEREFTASKRNKVLWETVASRMRERGFGRTPDQCKCKWKNLVNRYKGKETSDPDNGKQCPFFDELHTIFSERAKNLQQSLIVSKQVTTQSRKKLKGTTNIGQYSDVSEDEGDEGEDSDEESLRQRNNLRRKNSGREKIVEATPTQKSARPNNAGFVGITISSSSSIQEMLKVYFQQQQRIEMQWRESMERHRHERNVFEREWRDSMEKLERERLMVEQEWREREEQRKTAEEIREEKRDALLTTLLNKLISEDHL